MCAATRQTGPLSISAIPERLVSETAVGDVIEVREVLEMTNSRTDVQ
jgi:hypothetical protein